MTCGYSIFHRLLCIFPRVTFKAANVVGFSIVACSLIDHHCTAVANLETGQVNLCLFLVQNLFGQFYHGNFHYVIPMN